MKVSKHKTPSQQHASFDLITTEVTITSSELLNRLAKIEFMVCYMNSMHEEEVRNRHLLIEHAAISAARNSRRNIWDILFLIVIFIMGYWVRTAVS